MGGKKRCEVCEEAQSKYKCPTCLIPYCSLPCFKKHKEVPCVKEAVPTEEINASNQSINVGRPCYVDEPSTVLQQLQLESVASSSEILDALKNEELQKLIHRIDSSTDAETELDRAMEVDVFRLFTEKILSTIDS